MSKKSKRTVNHNSVSNDFEARLEEIRTALKHNYVQQKKLSNDLKELVSLHKREMKRKPVHSTRQTGFNKPEKVPESLKTLLDIDEDQLPRTEVTKKLYQYFSDNNMYNKKTKKEIIPNDELRDIFGMDDDDTITFYNLQAWLKRVYQANV